MPIYEYRCQTCQHEFEVMQKITENALTRCPECGKDTLSKLISRSSFQLKGSGWYVTDFKDSGKKAAAENKADVKSETSASPSTDSTMAAKTENKVETKSDVKTTSSTTKSEDK